MSGLFFPAMDLLALWNDAALASYIQKPVL